MTVMPGQTTCYRCLFNAPPADGAMPAPSTLGLLGVLPGVIGGIQATETLKYLLGIGELLTDRLLVYNGLNMRFRTVAARRNADCPLCGTAPSITVESAAQAR